VKVTGSIPLTVAVTIWLPAKIPRVHSILACPLRSVSDVGALRVPAVAVHVTVAPRTPVPWESVTLMTSGAANFVPTTDDGCPLPATTTRLAGGLPGPDESPQAAPSVTAANTSTDCALHLNRIWARRRMDDVDLAPIVNKVSVGTPPRPRPGGPSHGAIVPGMTVEGRETIVGKVGLVLIGGLLVAMAGTFGFVVLASHVESGATQAFDESVIRWMGAHQTKGLDAAMIEITALGTGTVVLMIVIVAALFLVLTQHKYSAILLLVSAFGGLVLNGVLKLGFDRPRPSIFIPAVNTVSSSFPSGHAMSAAIVYSTVAYLAARLHRSLWARLVVMLAALVLIVLICFSRLYLGVHYPSDVIAGVSIGLAWAALCMATLEGIQRFGLRHDPRILEDEKPAPDAT
jgi:undecaprenyl-diphosphatase